MNARIAFALAIVGALGMVTLVSPVHALDREHRLMAEAAIDRGIAYLRTQQGDDGSWSPDVGPAITALVLTGMLNEPDIAADDPQAAAAIEFILSHAREDGLISGGFLDNYNTAISASALTRVEGEPRVALALDKARIALRLLQWNGQTDPDGNVVDEDHPWYGGAGYGNSGRPDMSNTQFLIQAFYDLGVSCDDPAFQRAVAFVSRCQGHASNDLFADKIDNDGGFIYATSINEDAIGVPESKASPDMIDEGKAGRPVSGLRTYGSITYAGFKSYVYAQLDADDPRVTQAREWISRNYTLDRNPGMPEDMKYQGLYYMYLALARALDADGSTYITTPDGTKHDWANDLIAKLHETQRDDGSWVNQADRWMEDNPVLVTAYSVLALQHALD
mgnify:CR=1 FL=1